MDTAAWEDLPHWQFLTQTIAIIAAAKPETRGWRTAWPEIARRLRELKPEGNPLDVWADLNERCAVLRGNAPQIPAVQPAAAEPSEGAADRDLGGAGQSEGGTPADPYAELRAFARDKLRGQERAVIEALCAAGGELSIADLAVKPGVNFSDSESGFKAVRRRLNPKLKKRRWILSRVDNTAKLGALRRC